VHDLVETRADWQQLATRTELISKAEAGYRGDPAAARNLESVLWTTERRQAALAGEVLIAGPDTVRHHGPTLDLDKVAGRPVTQQPMSAWAEFQHLRARVDTDRAELLARIHGEIATQAADREAEILAAVPDMAVRDLAQAAVELAELARTLAATRSAAGLRPHQGAIREHISAHDVFDAAARYAAGQPYSLLTPTLEPARSVITDSRGLHEEHAPVPRSVSALPPAGVALKDFPATPEEADARVAAMTTPKTRPLGS
jgi:hypothetical protein